VKLQTFQRICKELIHSYSEGFAPCNCSKSRDLKHLLSPGDYSLFFRVKKLYISSEHNRKMNGRFSMKTEGLWYMGDKKIELKPMEVPELKSNEVLVEIESCGVCSWDVVAYLGDFGKYHPYPFCAGHEGVGRIVKLGKDVSKGKLNQRVALTELPIGYPGGALMARHAVRTENALAEIPEDGKPAQLWVVEPACCVVNGIIYAEIRPGDKVGVIGVGYMGLLFIQGLKRSLTKNVIALDIDPGRLELASRFGADEVINTTQGIPDSFLQYFDIVIETAGVPETMNMATRVARPGAVIENFAWHHHTHTFDLEDWHVNGWRILNIQPQMNPHFSDLYPRTISLFANGTFSNEQLVTHVASVDHAKEVYEAAADKKKSGYIKGAINFVY
jgi:threonine dehydrogenase-like Zn-dependent dehydrogenase